MITAPIIFTAYLVCGIIFMTLSEDSQPDQIKIHKVLNVAVGILAVFLWLPWLLLNMCFTKRDIWFRKKTND